ncbi:diacylglycerol/polyprenol kinase family protein [Persephonella sp.]
MMKLKKEIFRKIFHIISILCMIIPVELFGKYSVSVIMLCMLIFIFPISYFRLRNVFTQWYWKIIDLVEREKNIEILPARQAFSLSLGLLTVSLFFSEEVLKISIVSIAVYDGFATISGILFGKHKIPGTRKSLEGVVGGFVPNFIALLFLVDPFYSFLVTAFTAVVELISSDKVWFLDDNLTIPVAVAVFSSFLLNFPS